MTNENKIQAEIIKDLKREFPGCIVLKNDPNYRRRRVHEEDSVDIRDHIAFCGGFRRVFPEKHFLEP